MINCVQKFLYVPTKISKQQDFLYTKTFWVVGYFIASITQLVRQIKAYIIAKIIQTLQNILHDHDYLYYVCLFS